MDSDMEILCLWVGQLAGDMNRHGRPSSLCWKEIAFYLCLVCLLSSLLVSPKKAKRQAFLMSWMDEQQNETWHEVTLFSFPSLPSSLPNPPPPTKQVGIGYLLWWISWRISLSVYSRTFCMHCVCGTFMAGCLAYTLHLGTLCGWRR